MKLKSPLKKLFSKKESWYLVIFLAVILKISLFPFRLGDYNFYLEPWVNFIKNNGYTSSLKFNFYNYTPSYIYILILIAKTGLYPLYLIKIVSIIFEFLTAYFVAKILFIKYNNKLVFWISFGIIPLLPSILLNGAFWGQCDSIYSSFVVGSIYFILKKKQFLTVLFLGLAFAFKIQTAFILPFYFVLLLRGYIKWYYFFTIPAIYCISILPAWTSGRPVFELLSIYFSQSSYYEMLTIHFPNIYTWISNDYFDILRFPGFFLTIIHTLIFGLILSNKKYIFTFEIWVKLAFLSVIISPFLLPGMHERYLYLGDIMAVVYFCVCRKNMYLSLGIILISFYSYLCCSRLKDILPLWPAFIFYISIIIVATKDFISSLKVELKN